MKCEAKQHEDAIRVWGVCVCVCACAHMSERGWESRDKVSGSDSELEELRGKRNI